DAISLGESPQLLLHLGLPRPGDAMNARLTDVLKACALRRVGKVGKPDGLPVLVEQVVDEMVGRRDRQLRELCREQRPPRVGLVSKRPQAREQLARTLRPLRRVSAVPCVPQRELAQRTAEVA